MKNEGEIRASLKMHREALSFTKEEFRNRLKELSESAEVEIDPNDDVIVDRLFKEMLHIERAIIRELEWILNEELQQTDEWVSSILDNL